MRRADRLDVRSRGAAPATAPTPGSHALALTPARFPVQRPVDARLLIVDARGSLGQLRRTDWTDALRPGDLVVANDAATLPASLSVRHVQTGRTIELRLAGHVPRGANGALRYVAVAFGEGDWRTRTEDRAAPPALAAGDRLACGGTSIVVEAVLDHPRLLRVRFERDDASVWALLARHARPVQYSHLAVPLRAWDVATPIASRPVAFEAPSAGYVVDWHAVHTMSARGIDFATLTHAAGLSSTGDPALDVRLPLDEPYDIPLATVSAIARARARDGRVVAIGTTVVRALEHAAAHNGVVAPGRRIADQRIDAQTVLRVVDALITGTHEPGSSHYDLLRAFLPDHALAAATAELARAGYRTHEYGDSVLVLR